MRKRWARWLALLTGALVVMVSAAFAAIQNPAATADGSTPAAATAAPDADPARVERGRQLFDEQGCVRCHQLDGRGSPRSPLDGVGSRLPADEIRQWMIGDAAIADGLAPRTLQAKQPYQALPDDALDALVAYLQQSRE